MNLTFQQTMESNTSEEWEVFHRVFGSDFATVVLPVIYFIIFIIGAAGNVAVLFIILSSKVSETFTRNQLIYFVLLTKLYTVHCADTSLVKT